MSREVERPQSFPLILFFCWLSCRRGKWLSVRSVTSPCASLSVPAEESKGWSATIFYLLHSLIGKPKLILQIKNKPLTVSLLHFQSRPRGSKLHYILGRIYARIYPLDIGCLSCYNMCSGYIASSLKCYHFRTCEGVIPPSIPLIALYRGITPTGFRHRPQGRFKPSGTICPSVLVSYHAKK